MTWADPLAKARDYPHLDKRLLLGDDIAETSGHSRGATVDLGAGFDFFAPLAYTDAAEIDAAQRANRQRLLRALATQGFANDPLEWWHFTFRPEPCPYTAYDVPVR